MSAPTPIVHIESMTTTSIFERIRPALMLLCAALLASMLAAVGGGRPADAYAGADQPVILLHGFSSTGGHPDCHAYFGDLHDELENQGRTVVIVGYYAGNDSSNAHTSTEDRCDNFMSANSNTPIEDIAAEFRNYIKNEFQNGEVDVTVDIVAHSMGGLVTREMLDTYGIELKVDDVVTLGTPHAGTQGYSQSALCFFLPVPADETGERIPQ